MNINEMRKLLKKQQAADAIHLKKQIQGLKKGNKNSIDEVIQEKEIYLNELYLLGFVK